MTLDELISQVYETLEINADDSSIEDRFVESLIVQQRALWLRNEYNKNRTIDQNVVQELGCVEMIEVDRSECCEAPLGCKILRTKNPVPNTIEFHHDNAIVRVGPIDIIQPSYKEILYPKEVQFYGNGRTNSKNIAWFLKKTKEGLHIYLLMKNPSINYKLIEQINVQGIFEDPREAENYHNCNGSVCWSPSQEYPINAWMWNYILPEVLKVVQSKIQMPKDLDSDNKDNIRQQDAKTR